MSTKVIAVTLMSAASIIVYCYIFWDGESVMRIGRTFLQQDEFGRSKVAQLLHQGVRPTGTNSSNVDDETTLQLHDIDRKKAPPSLVDIDHGDVNLDALYERLVIVTAVSDNHVQEAMGMIKSAQTHMPDKHIYVYNLGLDPNSIKRLRSVCNVHVRDFNFSKYPPHTKKLVTMTWKVIILRETLAEFGVVFYGDASVRFKRPLAKIIPYLFLHHGFMAHLFGFDPKLPGEIQHYYYMTHPGMFKEMGLDKHEFYKATNADAPYFSFGRLLLANTSAIWEKLLNPVLECALKPECIAPVGSGRDNHHYDQSLAGIVMYENMRNEWTNETHNTVVFDQFVEIKRTKTDGGGVKTC